MGTFKVTSGHWDIFVDFFGTYPDLAKGRFSASSNGKDLYKKLWNELTLQLNSLGLGEKTTEKWQKTWSDFKCGLKKKAAEISRMQRITGGGPPFEKKLTEVEMKLLAILGETFYKGCNVPEQGVSIMHK